ncbi:MAG: DUF2855 family protein [Alphaproteobacteria bacterium]|nr:DUF2855 family protein [Alphaproteobacteria bacterium]
MRAESVVFEVDRSDLRKTRVVPLEGPDGEGLAPGEARLRVDAFALTANNISYAVFGDMLKYWRFFPAEGNWGRIPVWGFATVLASRAEGVDAGRRVYGYLPMASHLVLRPERVGAAGFLDGAPARAELHAAYNSYQWTDADPLYRAGEEPQIMLLRPLFSTSFLIEDFLSEESDFGAGTVIVSSASSKTSLALAACLKRARETGGRARAVTGLTSASHVGFVEGTGLYDTVLSYDALETLPAEPSVFVDMAGNKTVRLRLHTHLGDALKYSCSVGGTHWEETGGAKGVPGPRPTLFWAPERVKKRQADWGAGGLQDRMSEAWRAFLASAGGAIEVAHISGPEAVSGAYLDLLEGRTPPRAGLVMHL